MYIPSKDRYREGDCGQSRNGARDQSAPIPALQEENDEQSREDLACSGDGEQCAGQRAKSAQVTPAGSDDEQQKQDIELSE